MSQKTRFRAVKRTSCGWLYPEQKQTYSLQIKHQYSTKTILNLFMGEKLNNTALIRIIRNSSLGQGD